jgi:Repeat of unknown function (DUF5648)
MLSAAQITVPVSTSRLNLDSPMTKHTLQYAFPSSRVTIAVLIFGVFAALTASLAQAISTPVATDVTPLIFGLQPLGTSSLPQQLTITNSSASALNLTFAVTASNAPACGGHFATPLCSLQIAEAARSFLVDASGCTLIGAFGSCTISVRHTPVALLNATARLEIRIPGFPTDALTISLQGQGIPAQTVPGTVLAIEYFDTFLQRFFVTDAPDEMALLDNGTISGWMRTGQSFWVFPADGITQLNSSSVCRLYGPPPAGLNWHFYSASLTECAATITRFPGVWIVESSRIFDIYLPDVTTGACASGTTPVFRFFDPRSGDHRYTTDTTLTPFIRQAGWIAEGYGIDAVAMCSPE